MKKNLTALKQDRAEAAQALSNLIDAHLTAAQSGPEPRDFTEEERTAQAAAKAKVTTLDALINAGAARIELERAPLQAAPGSRIEGGHDNAVDRPWASFGEQMLAIVAAGKPGGAVDPRLFKAGPTGGSTGVASDGGFLVQTDFSTMLMDRAIQGSQLLPMCDTVEVSPNADAIEAPYIDETSRATGSRFGGVQVFRRSEAETVNAKRPKIGKFECQLEDMMGLAYLTGREIRDARVMEQVTMTAFESEVGFKIDDEIFRGNGVGMMTGFMASDALVTQAKISGQTAGTIKTGNLSSMWTRMPSRLKGGSFWLYNNEAGPQLDELSIVAGTSALEPRFVNYGPDGILRIKGRPAIEIEHCEALGTAGDIVLVNLKEYLVITKGGLKKDVSIHARFVYDEQVIRFLLPINGKPKMKTAITPYKGTATQSAYVALQTRA